MTARGEGGNAPGDIILDLSLSADEYLRYYSGEASSVLARARDGRMVRFPAAFLRRFVDHDGVHGRFLLRCDDSNRLVSIERIGARGTHGR